MSYLSILFLICISTNLGFCPFCWRQSWTRHRTARREIDAAVAFRHVCFFVMFSFIFSIPPLLTLRNFKIYLFSLIFRFLHYQPSLHTTAPLAHGDLKLTHLKSPWCHDEVLCGLGTHVVCYVHFVIKKKIFILLTQTSAAAPFVEDNLEPDAGTERREIDASVLLSAFSNWGESTLGMTYDYDHAMLFTA